MCDQAADRLGICEAALKRICRRNQIYKWPYRQLTSVRRRIAELNDRRADLLSERGGTNDFSGLLDVCLIDSLTNAR